MVAPEQQKTVKCTALLHTGNNRPNIQVMYDLSADDLMLFARLAETGSFSRTGERLHLPKSTVSRRITALEAHFGEKLVHRTTRKVALTDFGLRVLEHARAVAAEVEGAFALAQHRQAAPTGRLRVSLPANLASYELQQMLARFARENPAVTLELDISPRRVDLIGESFDLAIRFGDLPDDSNIAGRKLADLKLGLYASPSYVSEVGAPAEPDDLLRMHALLILGRDGEARPWILERDSDGVREQWRGKPKQHTTANSPYVLMRIAQAGTGVVGIPNFSVADLVKRGELVRILPEWSPPSSPCWAVFPGRRLMPTRTRIFLDALVDAMGEYATAA